MTHRICFLLFVVGTVLLVFSAELAAWVPLSVVDDPLIRMPGTQQNEAVNLKTSDSCFNCHAGYDQQIEPGFNWNGSMMAQAARDPIFWATLTVSAQDSIWLIGRPNATDLCLRCHTSTGWLQGRSDPTNGSALSGSDFDGVECSTCHRSANPFFKDIDLGLREGSDWSGYWDETNAGSTTSQSGAALTYQADLAVMNNITMFNGDPFFGSDDRPFSTEYQEAGGGQFYVSVDESRRASFADANARHTMNYSRFHKSKYFCNTCHDVSNPALANIDYALTLPGDGTTVLPSEQMPAYAYGHVERTFSEFMLSDYAQEGGADGLGSYAPGVFDTPLPGDKIGACQHCHMPASEGKGCDKNDAILRATGSIEHPKSGQPVHDFTGGNAFISYILASAIPGSPVHDSFNEHLMFQGLGELTMDLNAGMGVDPDAMLEGSNRALDTLSFASDIVDAVYDPQTGQLSFKIQNNTGHRLPSGYPEGRRIFANIKVYSAGQIVYEINPYDTQIHTLKGLDSEYSPNSPALETNEEYVDELVFEVHSKSSFLDGAKTFHFVLADGSEKDNRIPPKGYRIDDAAKRQAMPIFEGEDAPNLFNADEYAGGFDSIAVNTVSGANSVEINLYYQVTSREFIEFLRDEINGDAHTLDTAAYIIQSDPFFDKLSAWGDTIWQLWEHNADLPGAAPVLIASATVEGSTCSPQNELCDEKDNDCDGEIDEDFEFIGQSCTAGVGECMATGSWVCSSDGSQQQCNAQPLSSVPEVCDGLDNDCDGVVDNGCECSDGQHQACYTGPGGTEDEGLCKGGIRTCVSNQFGPCENQVLPQGEICDEWDNDCDGSTDEGFPALGLVCSVGQGQCLSQGLWICNDTNDDVQCNASVLSGDSELCDGLDNDCNGSTDETFDSLGASCTMGLGQCLSSGNLVCNAQKDGLECDAPTLTGSTESCDGLDNDCDGVVDNTCACTNEDTQTCYTGPAGTQSQGDCLSGSQICDGGVWGACNGETIPGNEVCDLHDNDCDGLTDEEFSSLGEVCVKGVGECAWSGLFKCAAGGLSLECEAPTIDPAPEVCDGADNDCDGQTDEEYPQMGEACVNGLGECAVTGSWICPADGDAKYCDAQAADPQEEICDELDNNCDGLTDEGFENGDTCDDSDLCSHSDIYNSCVCEGTLYECVPGQCEQSSSCDGQGGCTEIPSPPGTECDDLDPLTVDDECKEDGSCKGTSQDPQTDSQSESDTFEVEDTDEPVNTDEPTDTTTLEGDDSPSSCQCEAVGNQAKQTDGLLSIFLSIF